MSRLITLLALLVISMHTSAQTYEMDNVTGQTITTCSGSFFDSQIDFFGDGNFYYDNGENFEVTFCSSTPGDVINFEFDFIQTVNDEDTLWVYDGADITGDVVGVFTGGYGAQSIIGYSGCLTFVFKSTGGFISTGWEASITCFNIPAVPLQSACTNIGFESGDFSGWYGTYGIPLPPNNGGGYMNPYTNPPNPPSITIGPVAAPTATYTPNVWGSTASAQHNIMTGAGVDAFGGFPVVSPTGGAFSMMLGDGPQGGYEGASIEQKFDVTAANAVMTYSYAIVIQDANLSNPHLDNDQPFFKIEAFDCNGDPILCGDYLVIGGPGIPGFTLAPGTADVYYKDWTDVFLDLTPYIGSCVTVKFTQGDCALGAHYSYVYLDATCEPLAITGPQWICPGESTTLVAPPGGATYAWLPGGETTQSITVSPAVLTNYTCTITSVVGPMCFTSTDYWVDVHPPSTVTSTSDVICIGSAGTLLATGNSVGGTYSWLPGGLVGVTNDFSPTVNTDYTVTFTDANLCSSEGIGTITVDPLDDPTFTTIDFCFGTANAASVTGLVGGTFTFNPIPTDGATINAATGEITNGVSGVAYNIEYTTNGICPNSLIVPVSVIPLDDPTFTTTNFCIGTANAATVTGVAGGTFTFNPIPTDGATISPTTGEVSNGVVNTTYDIEYTTNSVCPNSLIVPVTVNPLPTITTTDETICLGGSIDITALGAGTGTYSWSPATELNTTIGGTVTSTPTADISYTVTGTDDNGCVNTNQVDVIVNPKPSPIINGATEYCIGTSSTLSTANSYTTYLWTTGDVTPTSNVTIADNPISVTVTNAFGCPGTSANFMVIENTVINYSLTETICAGESVVIHGISQSVAGLYSQTFILATGCDSVANVTLVVNPLPVIDAGLDQVLCLGESVILTATGSSTYAWDNGIINSLEFTPAVGAVTYTVTGTDANGCVNTDDVLVTVNPLPIVDAGTDVVICEGENVTLSGSGANTYVWNNGINDGVVFTPNVGTVIYTIVGTDVNGCVGNDQVEVLTNPTPIVDAGIDQEVCVGEMVTLNPTGANTYVWDNGVVNNVPFTPAVGTVTYSVTGTDINSCINSDQVTVIVNDLPVVGAGTDDVLCFGTNVTLAGTGANSYSWNNGVVNGVQFTPSVGAVIYTVTGTDVNGCVNTDQVTITTNPLPNVSGGVDYIICLGESITLSGSGADTYLWDNGVIDGNEFTPTLGTFIYTVTGTDVNGCVNTDQIIVVVNPLPNVYAGVDVNACENDESIVLTASGALTYVWNNGVTNGISFSPVAANYSVVGTDVNGCIGMDDLDITVQPNPVVSFIAEFPLCAPFTGFFVNTTSTSGTPVSCVWNINNGVSFTGCADTMYYTLPSSGTYDVTLSTTTDIGCFGSLTQVDIISLQDGPVASFNPVSTSLSTLSTEVQFNNTSTGAVAYEWMFGDETPNSSVVNPNHTFPAEESGTFLVTLVAISNLGCVDTAIAVVNVEEELIFYVPNTFTPDGDDYNEYFKPIFTSGFDPFDYELMIFDRWGEIVFESHDSEIGWDGTYAGSYKVQDGTYTWKITFKTSANDERRAIYGHVNIVR